MTVIFSYGDEFWIEFLALAASIPDAAGQTSGGLVSLQRPGLFLGGAIAGSTMVDNDNTQVISAVELRDAGTVSFGDEVSQFRVRVNKAAGTAGATNTFWHAIIFMRKRGD